MNINYSKGSDPQGLVKYVLDRDKQRDSNHSPVLATNMSGQTVEELAEEFRFSHDLNPRVQKTMAHYSISLSPDEQVSPTQIASISQALLQKVGHGECQYLVAQHHDREHRHGVQHWHIVTSAVDLDGQWVKDSFIKLRLKEAEIDLEREFGLIQKQVREEKERHNLTTGEYRLKERTGKELPKEKLWTLLQQHSQDQPAMTDLVMRLKAEEVSVRLYERNGKIDGISYAVDGVAFPGYRVGKSYSFEGLQKHLNIRHSAQQDEQLRQINALNAEQCRNLLQQQVDQEMQKRQWKEEGDLKKKQDEPLLSTQPVPISELQLERASQILPVAVELYGRGQDEGEVRQIAPGRWQLEGYHYAILHDEVAGKFSLSACDGRGELVRCHCNEAGELQEIEQAQGIGPRDVTAFYEMQRLMEQLDQQEQQQRQRGGIER